MNSLAQALGRIIAVNSPSTYEEDEIRYGLEVFLGGLLQVLLLAAIGWHLGLLKEIMAIMLSFGLYRRCAGGAHCTAYYRCTLMTLITLPVLAYLCRLIDNRFFWVYFMVVFLFSMEAIYLKAPVDTDVKPIVDPAERSRLKLRSAILIVLLQAAVLGFHWFGQDLLAIAVLIGICYQSLTMTRLGASYVRFWDIILSKWWGNNWGKEEC